MATVVRISSLRSAFACLRVSFPGSGGSLVGAGCVMVVWGCGSVWSWMITVFYLFTHWPYFKLAISISAFLTAITMGVCAVAVSKFSIYLNLLFETPKTKEYTYFFKRNLYIIAFYFHIVR